MRTGHAGDQLYLLSIEYLDAAKFAELMPAHRAWLIERYEEGSFIVSGGLTDHDGSTGKAAIAIIRASDQREAEALVADEPFHVGGACRHTVRHFNPRMHSLDFGRIYAGTQSTAIAPRGARP